MRTPLTKGDIEEMKKSIEEQKMFKGGDLKIDPIKRKNVDKKGL